MKNRLMKLLCVVLAVSQIFTLTAFAKPDWPNDTGIQAESGIVMDVDSGAVIFGQNIHVEYIPASITKILTALLVVENCDLSDTVVFSETAMNSVEADSGNKLSLVAGDSMTVEDALYALLLQSVNQAANALAEHTAGSMSAFVDMMNEKLVELGCTESHFDNPSGLNGDTQYVTAYDMALIASAAYKNEEVLKISSTIRHQIPPTANNPDGVSFRHEHRLVYTDDSSSEYYFPEAVAGKTGYLIKAGNTLVTYAEKDGRRLVSVILKGQPRQYFLDGKSLLQFGFDNFKNVEIAENEERYVTGDGSVELLGTSYSPDELMIEPGRMLTLPKTASFQDVDLTLEPLPESHPENAVGLLQYTYNTRKVGQAFLMTKENSVPAGAPGDQVTGEDADNPDQSGQPGGPDGSGSAGEPGDNAGNNPDANSANTQNPEKDGNGLSGTMLMTAAGIVAVAGLAAAAVIYITRKRKKEAEALALRRAERRRRLSMEGETDEFERLLEVRKSGGQNRKSRGGSRTAGSGRVGRRGARGTWREDLELEDENDDFQMEDLTED